MACETGALSSRQRELLEEWLPGAVVLRDHSWGLLSTIVLKLKRDDVHYIVKAGGPSDHHLARELRAHRSWLDPWTSLGRAPRLLAADDEAKLLLREYVEGDLVEGGPFEHIEDTYFQAGMLLALLHGQQGIEDGDFDARANEKTLDWLRKPHRIPSEVAARLRAEVASWPAAPAVVVPTHGDWQPRNWLIHDGVVRVIDLGRAELRPPLTDFTRLAAQQFRGRPDLESAFIEGYGRDPREPDAWRRCRIREAVGTAVWAHQVGDESFERQGLRMIEDALAG